VAKLGSWKLVGIVFVFCAAAAIGLPAQTLTTLHSFEGPPNDGALPQSSLIQASDGNFYGSTGVGGADRSGTVFKITSSGTLTMLYSFCSQTNCADGSMPEGELVQASDGNFYGTNGLSGAGQGGTIFKMTPSGTLSTLYSFCSQPNCADGSNPYAGLVQATDGNFYGVTDGGGASGYAGTVFKMTPSGTLTTLYSFCSQPDCADGFNPYSRLVQGSDGNFYGTTPVGGINGDGTVFQITPTGTLTTLHTFNYTDGSGPSAGLVQGSDGNFYGTTYEGGTSLNCSTGCGTVFKITSSGTLTTLYNFSRTDGANPFAALVQAADENFYGATTGGGAADVGTVFKITASGTLTTLHSFVGSDGVRPNGLVQASDGNFYGTTYQGGASRDGTVFTLPPTSPQQLVSVTPCRLLDTRPDRGGDGPIQGGTSQSFNLPQLAQAKGCADLSSAAVYSLNVAVVPQGSLSYLTLWPTGQPQPLVATLNSLDGRIKANAAIVQAGSLGAVSVYVTNTTNVIIDIDGYFAPPSSSTLTFYPLTPCRVADTRKSNFPPGLGVPHLFAGTERDFPVLSSTCSIPTSAQAYSLNLAVVPYPTLGSPLGYLEVWPTGNKPQNPVSTLNNLTGTVVANAAIVPAGTGSDITVFASNDTDLVIDINGYFAPAGPNGLSLYAVTPCRVIDTRQLGPPFGGLLTPPVDVENSACAPSASALAYVFNATVVPTGGLGYLTLWPDGENQPLVSTLNALDGWITNNMAIVPTNNGKVDAFASGITQLILDISSYFAP
jgi:uncharacterized repeat protein (TIGR03803 family)